MKKSYKLAIPFVPATVLFLLLTSPLLLLPQLRLYFTAGTGFPIGYHLVFSIIFLFAIFASVQLTLGPLRHVKCARILAVAALLGFVLAAVAFAHFPNAVSRSVGAPSLYLAAILTIYLTGYLVFSISRIAGLALLMYIVLRLVFGEIYHPFRTLPFLNEVSGHYDFRECSWGGINCAFQEWLVDRPNLEAYREKGVPYPVFLVSAEGGGIYAAGHAFAALEMAATVCPSFRQHVFTISSVSGGSFGAAAFAIDQRFGERLADARGCEITTVPSPETAFSADHFSRVLASFVFSNLPSFLVPHLPDRLWPESSGEALEVSFEAALDYSDISISTLDYWRTEGTEPILLLNTADVIDGKTAVVSPIRLTQRAISGPTPGSFATIPQNVRISTAASLSARFPFITPSGSSPRSPVFRPKVYADAGYIDSSGITTTLAVMDSLVASMGHGIDRGCARFEEYCNYLLAGPYRFRVNSDPVSEEHSGVIDCVLHKEFEICAKAIWDQSVVPVQIFHINLYSESGGEKYRHQRAIDPLRALLSARTARGEIARKDLEFRFLLKCVHNYDCDQPNPPPSEFPVFNLWLDNETLGLPLSWSLGKAQYDEIREELRESFKCDGQRMLPGDNRRRCMTSWLSGILSGMAFVR